jgi:hypothetical protein
MLFAMKTRIIAAVLAALAARGFAAPFLDVTNGNAIAVGGTLAAPAIVLEGMRLTHDGGKSEIRFSKALATTGNGDEATVEAEGKMGATRIHARLERRGEAIDATLRIACGDDLLGLKAGETMLLRHLGRGITPAPDVVKTAHWVRDANGGYPHEEPLGAVELFSRADGGGVFAVAYAPGSAGNPKWRDAASASIGFTRENDGSLVSRFTIFPGGLPQDMTPASAAAEIAGLPFSTAISTARVYNWFDDPSAPIVAELHARNCGNAPREISLNWWIRDWDGTLVASGSATNVIPAHATLSRTVSFRPDGDRGIFFAECSACDTASGEELAFHRTNLSLLPPYRFSSKPDNSIFGIAAYWPIPDEERVQRLMDRMGVRWVRHGDTRLQHTPRICCRHTKWPKGEITDEERDAWIRRELESCIEQGNPFWEFCNEINMSTAGIAMEGGGIGKALLAPKYVEWVKAIARIKKAKPEYAKIGLLSFGIAGLDKTFIRRIHELGVWDCLDGIALHPGRGNFTPDYPYLHPETPAARPPETGKISAHSNFWNYLGAVRGARELIAEQGDKPLWLTEVYAPTPPNGAWEDTLRDSADNALLTLALAKAEGVRAVMWYQLFDSVWHNRLGAKHTDREYYFGLVNRDLSFKPALFAYAAAAEALDGDCAFLGWIDRTAINAPDTTHGLLFSTPRGPLAVLWDRSEGYVLSNLSEKPYRAPEPWTRHWTRNVRLRLPPSQGQVKLVDSIGRHRTLPSGSEIMLDGSPVMVSGVSFPVMQMDRNSAELGR